MKEAFVCDAVRSPFGRYGGTLAAIRADDLAAIPIQALIERNPTVDWSAVDDVVFGCANQAGEDKRIVGLMALLLAGLLQEVPEPPSTGYVVQVWMPLQSRRGPSSPERLT